MVSKILVAVCLLVAVASVAPQAAPAGPWGPPAWAAPPAAAWGPPGAGSLWIPPWISSAAWYPKWVPCTTIGSSCTDCNTKQVCTKIGGMERACADPLLPYCNLGECSATPTAECAPAPAVPAA